MFLNRLYVPMALLSLIGWLPAASLPGAEFRHHETKLTIAADEVIEDDLYATSGDVVIEGTVKGDLIAAGLNVTIIGTVEGNVFATGQVVTVKGTVQGDLIAAGQAVVIEGRVTDDARVAGQVVKVTKSGYVGGDLFAAGASLEFEEGSNVTTDTVYFAAQALLAGKLGRNVVGMVSSCQLDGEVGGNVWIEVDGDGQSMPPQAFGQPPPGVAIPQVAGGLNVGPDAKVGGKLSYKSVKEATIANPAAIAGGVEHVAVVPKAADAARPPPGAATIAVNRLKAMAAVAIIGLATVLLLPRWSSEMAANLRYRFVMSVIAGLVGVFAFIALLMAIFAVMIVAMIVFGGIGLDDLTLASLGLGVFGTISLIGLLWFGLSFLAPTVVCVFVGRFIGRSPSFPTIAAFLIGLVVVAILWAIPYAGFWIAWAIITLGFGAFCVWLVAGAPPELELAQAVAKR